MTKKKRELIEILLDNVKPEDWPKNAVYAAQDKETLTWGKWVLMFYSDFEIPHVNVGGERFVGEKVGREIKLPELCENWNKTIVHRDEFMKRWNERNKVVDSEGWIQWNGGEMPVEKGTLIDVKYRDGLINLHVIAGFGGCSTGSIKHKCAINFNHYGHSVDIIAYRLHTPQQQKTPQQLALEKFGTDWHENDGRIPRTGRALIDIEFSNGRLCESELASYLAWELSQSTHITRWRVHSETDTTTPPAQQEVHTEETKPIQQDEKFKAGGYSETGSVNAQLKQSATDTQIGGNHYTKLAIQPMQYSMKNGLDALQHTIIKYVTRFRDKNGIEDLEKAKHCIDMLIEFEKEQK